MAKGCRMGGRRSIVDWAQSNFIRPAEQVDRQRVVCDGLGMGGRMKVFQKALVRDWRADWMQRMRLVNKAGCREARMLATKRQTKNGTAQSVLMYAESQRQERDRPRKKGGRLEDKEMQQMQALAE